MLALLRRTGIAMGAGVLGALLRLYRACIRFEAADYSELSDALDQGPVIYCFFHNRLLLMPFGIPFGRPFRPVGMLISASDDGTLIAKAVSRLEIEPIRGSSSRQASQARSLLLQYLQAGGNVGITPDGPKGPKYVVKPGVLWLARQSGAAIAMLDVRYSRFWQLGSWDGFWLPKPCSRAAVRVQMHRPDPTLDFDQQLSHLQQQMLDFCQIQAGE